MTATLGVSQSGSTINISGNAATASAVAASGITGTTLASNVVTSLLTSVGHLTDLVSDGLTLAGGGSNGNLAFVPAGSGTELQNTVGEVRLWSAVALRMRVKTVLMSDVAVPANGTGNVGVHCSSTANLGHFYSDGVPTMQAAKGSTCSNVTASTASTRFYVNENGLTNWVPILAAA